jgi:hypothetical protein
MFTLKVQDFGPIAEGTATLRPLTVLIGPNNAGKSYFALLTYALTGPFGRPPAMYRRRWGFWRHDLLTEPGRRFSEKERLWLAERSKQKEKMRFDQLPAEIKESVQTAIEGFIPKLAEGLSQELQRGFATKLADLGRKRPADGFRLWLDQSDPELKLQLSLMKGNLHLDKSEWNISSQFVDLAQLRNVPARAFDELVPGIVLQTLLRTFFSEAYYFPAARSGILQGHKALASSILSRIPLVGIEPFEIPTLSGVLADFIGNVLRLEKHQGERKVSEVGSFLEENACKGKVDIGATEEKFEYPEIYYQLGGTKLPLHRTSSMVSEIAPIILFLKYVVERGDLLIIEEPEAHLHPDNQRTLALAMVKLVRLGVRLIITTHSDYFLHQVSNFVQLARMADKRRELGYSQDDYLLPEEVGSYLFCFDNKGDGTHIKELKVTEEDGIPEDEFARIYEALYEETLSIERSLRR